MVYFRLYSNGGALYEVFLIELNASATRQSVLAQEKPT